MKLVNVVTKADYRLTRGENFRGRLPKRADSSVSFTLDGVVISAPVTVNKMWAGTADALVYPWILVGGEPYYVTLRADETLEGEFVVMEGAAVRPDPKRATSKVDEEKLRVARLSDSLKKRFGPVPA